MKFTTIVAAALPLLAAAGPRSIPDGSYQGVGSIPSTHPRQGGYAVAPGIGGQDAHQPPMEIAHSPANGDGDTMGMDAHWADDGHSREGLGPRDLEPRVDNGSVDHYIEECSIADRNPDKKLCLRNLIVPKGKVIGGCVERMQKGADAGTIHILDANVMCRYYGEANCQGRMSGPYSNQECDYTFASVYFGQVIDNPQSYQCEIISFDETRWPVQPPKPDPIPEAGSTYDCKLGSALAKDNKWFLFKGN